MLLIGILTSLSTAVWGALLAFAPPETFLRFHEREGEQAEWRKKVDTRPYQFLGVLFIGVGLFFAWGLAGVLFFGR